MKQRQPQEPIEEQWIATLKGYLQDGTVFHSSHLNAQYAVDTVDDFGAIISRLTANDPAEVTTSRFKSMYDSLHREGGAMPFGQVPGSVAVRVAFLQHPSLALSADRQQVLHVTSTERATDLLCEYVADLNVDSDGDNPRLYQPALIDSVLDAIDEGQISENRIEFRWLVDRFERKLQGHGSSGLLPRSKKPAMRLDTGWKSVSLSASDITEFLSSLAYFPYNNRNLYPLNQEIAP